MTDKEKMRKIRKMLGNRYHLCESLEYCRENGEKIEFVVYKEYENGDPIYFSSDNKPILSSKTHTIDDLYEFAKKHQKYDLQKANKNARFVILGIAILLSWVNFFVDTGAIISTICLTTDAVVMIWLAIDQIIYNRNWKVDMLELAENFERKFRE